MFMENIVKPDSRHKFERLRMRDFNLDLTNQDKRMYMENKFSTRNVKTNSFIVMP